MEIRADQVSCQRKSYRQQSSILIWMWLHIFQAEILDIDMIVKIHIYTQAYKRKIKHTIHIAIFTRV